MTRVIRCLKVAVVIIAGLFALALTTYWIIPVDRINSVINKELKRKQISIMPVARKTVLPGLKWRNAEISSPKGVVVVCDDISLRLRLTPLLLGRVKLDVFAAIGNGRIDMTYSRDGGENVFNLKVSDLDLADITLLKTTLPEAEIIGKLNLDGALYNNAEESRGEFRVEIKKLGISETRLKALLPIETRNLHCQGVIHLDNEDIRLQGVSIQGDGLYARLSGTIRNNGDAAGNLPLDLALEIMPKSDYLKQQKIFFHLLSRFMVSAGYYRIPLRGTLLNPEIF